MKGRKSTLTGDQQAFIKANQQLTDRQIAEVLGITGSKVQYYRKKKNLPKRSSFQPVSRTIQRPEPRYSNPQWHIIYNF